MSKLLNILCWLCFSAVLMSSCGKDYHDREHGLVIGLDISECVNLTVRDISLSIYDTDGTIVSEHGFAGLEELASLLIDIAPGNYTVRAVVNAEFEGRTIVNVDPVGITRTVIKLQKIVVPDSYPVRLRMRLPDHTLPDYTACESGSRSQAGNGYALRAVVELCRDGDNVPVFRLNVNPEIQSDGRVLVEFDAPHGTYGLRIWTDRVHPDHPTSDYLYDTGALNSVSLLTGPYQAGASLRDASYHYGELTHDAELTELEIELLRPLAKYRLVADDVSRYNELHDKYPDKYPPLSDLTVEVAYEYFFPSVFNVVSGRPVDSATGVSYASVPEPAAGFPPGQALMVAHDCVLTNGSDSFVALTVKMCAPDGKEVARSSGIRVDYRRGYLTTVKGNFLTAGTTSGGGGVSIDTDWEDDIIIEF